MCMAACPFNVWRVQLEEPVRISDVNYGDARVPVSKGVMEKCTLCKERTDDGDVPMCVRVPPPALGTFGGPGRPRQRHLPLLCPASAPAACTTCLEEKGTCPQLSI